MPIPMIHPAPGIEHGGTLPPGFLVAPKGVAARKAYGMYRSRGIAEIIPGAFRVPENPVMNYVRGVGGGLGCSCGGSCGSCSGSLNGIGVGDLTADWGAFNTALSAGNYTGAAQSTFFGLPAWGLLAAAAALLMFSGRKGR